MTKTVNFTFMSKAKFPFQKTIFTRNIKRLVKKTKQLYVLLAFAECHFATTSFDFWIFKGAYNVFGLIINILRKYW